MHIWTCCIVVWPQYTEETEAQEFRKRNTALSVSVFLSLCLSYTHINRIATFLWLKEFLRSCVHLLIFQLRRACQGCNAPNKYLLNWKLHLGRCLICPVSVGLIINGTASQNVSHSLGYKFSSLQTLQNVSSRIVSARHLSDGDVRW